MNKISRYLLLSIVVTLFLTTLVMFPVHAQTPEIHDINVTNVEAYPAAVIVGYPVYIDVGVLNEGTVQETFDVNTYYDSTLIGTITVTLSSGGTTTLTFTWDTTGVSPGTYTIKAEVPPVTGETQFVDNEFIAGGVTIYPVPVPVYVDIKPGSWPNPINVQSKGVLTVAICGTAELDVTTIDPSTIKIHAEGIEQGVSPLLWSLEDVATPYTGDPGDGHDLDGDGYLDLVLHFKTQETVAVLTLTGHGGETLPLIIKGNLQPARDGTPIQGQDYVRVIADSPRISRGKR